MHRREVLEVAICVVGVGGLSGCSGDGSSASSPTESPSSASATPTETATASATPTETPVPFPETCEPLPDIEGLPTPPSELTEESVEAFVEEFERVYAVATNDEYGGVESLRIHSVETAGDRYVVRLAFDAVPTTATPDADGETPTPLPTDAYTHRAVYRLTDDRMLREVHSHIDDSLLSRTCWTLARG